MCAAAARARLSGSGHFRAHNCRGRAAAPAESLTPPGLSLSQEGFFGFKPFPEQWAGRMAMLGFASGVTGELATGKGILGQLGVETPDSTVLLTLAVLMGGATAFATARTLFRLTSGSMTVGELRRYSSFFGLSAEAQAAAEAAARKRAGDFTGATDLNAIDAARAAGTLADAALMTSDATPVVGGPAPVMAADAAAAPAEAAPKRMTAEEREIAYARDVELTNGRWAMLGFAAAILVEAATGAGVVGQLEMYAKFSGLLGAQSGF